MAKCQQRCLNTEGCVYFNAFPNGGLHITDGRDGTSIGEYRQDVIDLDPRFAGTNPTIKQEEQGIILVVVCEYRNFRPC